MRGAIVLVQRGVGVGERVDASITCTFSLKIWNAQKAGAAAVIVLNNVYYGNVVMGSDGLYDTNITIPGVFVDRGAGLQLFALVQVIWPQCLSLLFQGSLTVLSRGQEAMRSSQAVDVSITNSTESSLRLTVTEVMVKFPSYICSFLRPARVLHLCMCARTCVPLNAIVLTVPSPLGLDTTLQQTSIFHTTHNPLQRP